MRLAVVTGRSTPTNDALAQRTSPDATWETLSPAQALEELGAGDGALGRLDVLPTLDGMDDGLLALGALVARGVAVLNDPPALLAAHDKLLTARILRRNDIPHPWTTHVRGDHAAPRSDRPLVLKPRFGSWGLEVHRCENTAELEQALAAVRGTPWYERHGALVQELVPPQGYDLRIVVAAGRVVGAVYRVAAPGEWRTNIALGGVRRPVADPPRAAAALALAAAQAIGIDLAGVDLLPDGEGGWVVAELNGAVEFTQEYAAWGDIFGEVSALLAWEARDRLGRVQPTLPELRNGSAAAATLLPARRRSSVG
jgi:[lysine-biosynthesis-protein LysW]---L-2-aminoadipate ligase